MLIKSSQSYPLFHSQQVRELDRALMQSGSVSAFDLMTKAAQAAFLLLRQTWPNAKQIVVFAGAGNNGGDAWLVAKLAKEQGLDVQLYYLGDANKSSAEATQAKQAALAAGVNASAFQANLAIEADLIVDGLLGIGIKGKLSNEVLAAINQINQAASPVLALDLPSGLNADTGAVPEVAVKADLTQCFIALKQGMFTASGPDYCGTIYLAELGQQPVVSQTNTLSFAALQQAQMLLPKRVGNSHKGDYGHALLIGGDQGMGGALILAAEACLRAGVGLLTCATREHNIPPLLARLPTAMTQAVRSGLELTELLTQVKAIAIGPGLGTSSWAELLLQPVLQSKQPLVLDADSLNLLAAPAQKQKFTKRQVILTPHPGEAARLLKISSREVQQNRFQAALKIAQKYQAVVILKGQGSLIASPSGDINLCCDGNPGMSSGGMGDSLTGILLALLAQGLDAWQAANLGTCLHAKAADLCAAEQGLRGMLAPDLAPYIRHLVNA
ncbi:MAG: NAD(P)H-hydrate dehydratase [Venatoribacter sp.]